MENLIIVRAFIGKGTQVNSVVGVISPRLSTAPCPPNKLQQREMHSMLLKYCPSLIFFGFKHLMEKTQSFIAQTFLGMS